MKLSGGPKKVLAVIIALCMAMGLCACGSSGDSSSDSTSSYIDYVIGIMDANYLGVYDKYMELTGASEEDAQLIYEANIQELAAQLGEALSMDMDYVSDDIIERLVAMAETLYGYASYEAVDVVRSEDTYTITVEITPVNFWAMVLLPFEEAVDEFNTLATEGEYDDYSNRAYEEAYAEMILDAVEEAVEDVIYGTAAQYDVVLDYNSDANSYDLSDETIALLDAKVLSMSR